MRQPMFVEDNPVMAYMFRGFVLWLWDQEEAHKAFQEHSGLPRPKAVGIEALIGQSCGLTDKYVEGFVDWAIQNHWGEEGK